MKSNASFNRLTRNAFLLFVIIIVNLMSYFSDLKTIIENFIRNCGVTNQTLLDAFVIFAISVCVLVLYFIFSTIKREITKRKLIIHQIETPITFSPGGSGERITDFQNLRASAKESIIVMGVGMTYFSSDLSLLDKLIERQLNVRLLMMNPNVIGPESTDEESEFICNMKSNFHISNDYFDEFFSRKNYFTDIRSSYERLVNFIEQRITDSVRKGKVELRTYPYLIPMNITAADENKGGSLLLEFCLPFTDHRVRLNLSKKLGYEIYKLVVDDINKLWRKSQHVVDDHHIYNV